MNFRDLYSELPEGRDPADVSFGQARPKFEWDEIVFRAGFSSIPMVEMPTEIKIGRVTVSRTVGPVFSQQTVIRQAHGIPVKFDKSMRLNVPVGTNEVLTVCEIREPRRDDLGTAFNEWREEAQSALGILSAVIDDRVAINPLFEDAILLDNGIPVRAADTRSRLRTFLPFEITDVEKKAIAELGELSLDELSEVTEAARWYAKAVREGPTADGVVYLWIAVESMTPHPTTSPKKVEALLTDLGFDLAEVGVISVGRMSDVRARIVHESQRDHKLIDQSYYGLETIVRVLIRGLAGVASSWPASVQEIVFGPEQEAVAAAVHAPETRWHSLNIPPPVDAEPAGFPWSGH